MYVNLTDGKCGEIIGEDSSTSQESLRQFRGNFRGLFSEASFQTVRAFFFGTFLQQKGEDKARDLILPPILATPSPWGLQKLGYSDGWVFSVTSQGPSIPTSPC